MARAQGLIDIACLPEPFDGERLREITRVFEDRPHLWARIDVSGGELTPEQAIYGEVLGRVYADGAPVALYVLHFYQGWGGGTEAFITFAHGAAEFDLCAVVLPLIEQQCAGCAGIGMNTRRPGLIRKLKAAGYVAENHTGSAQMRKAL
ncbi:hypothetical protein [Paraburkholderia mimosarum]|uniref:hypothetical protein n=1 Tax=Paraburkholderia mimosarum TaxID=312026 RepID=UPI000402741B|nr:hypothetical protein [Paraburkholderia mimosarum]